VHFFANIGHGQTLLRQGKRNHRRPQVFQYLAARRLVQLIYAHACRPLWLAPKNASIPCFRGDTKL